MRDAEIRRLKLASGGPTGVDRAALEVALAPGLPVGGWYPKRRRAADGVIPARYRGIGGGHRRGQNGEKPVPPPGTANRIHGRPPAA